MCACFNQPCLKPADLLTGMGKCIELPPPPTMPNELTIEILVATIILTISCVYWCYTCYHHRCTSKWNRFASLAGSQVVKRTTFTGRENSAVKAGLHIHTYASTKSSAALIEAIEGVQRPEANSKGVESSLAEIRIPKRIIGLFIGKLGIHIKQMQKDSNTTMHLNDELLENGDRMCVIRGTKGCVNLATEIVSSFLESLPVTISKEILVPKNSVGKIIGHDGKGIRSIEEESNASVYIDMTREAQNNEDKVCRFAVLKGTKEQVDKAEKFISAIVEDRKVTNVKNKQPMMNSARSVSIHAPLTVGITNSPIGESFQQPCLKLDGKVEVFVSCVYHPNMFWIQLIGRESIDLRRLSEAMTNYYYQRNMQNIEMVKHFRPGDVVAAPFHWDGKMYRARVLRVNNDNTLEIEYVDYGDRRTIRGNFVRPLVPEFFRPKFQAIEATLNLLCPDPTWSNVAIAKFCDLSYCAQWKSLTAEFKGFVTDDRGGKIARVLVDLVDKHRNISKELIQRGLAADK